MSLSPPEKLREFTRQTIAEILSKMPAAERVKGLTPAERLKGLTAAERLKGLTVEEIARALSREIRTALARQLNANESSEETS